MILLKNFINIFRIPELRKRVLFTLGIFVVYRLGNYIPVIGIDIDKLGQFIAERSNLGGILSYLDLFSGGNLKQCTLFALGIGPYVTASIMMQILSMSVPSLEQLSKEGEYGRKLINQYTRYLACILAVVQSIGYAVLVERNDLAIDSGWAFRLMFVLSISVGSIFVMWMSEQISLYGIGSGSSMIIFAGIVARFPDDIIKMVAGIQQGLVDPIYAVLIFAVILAIAAAIIYIEKGERKIPVQYTRRVVGQRIMGGQSSYIPFKINTAGVMPVIFSNAIINAPVFIANLLASRFPLFKSIADALNPTGILYSVIDFFLIIFFFYFYTALVYNPDELAENIKKQGGFIPGIRPGKKTAEFFNYILNRVGLMGAFYLAMLALLPTILQTVVFKLPFYLGIMSGTSLLIVVGVALEFASQVEAYLIENRYEGFLTTGRFKSRSLR